MKKTVFYLKTCSTNKRIMSPIDLTDWNLREIKSQPITPLELETMRELTESYENLFSKKSSQIKAQNIDVKSLKEEDFKKLILEHYSFLKRPVFIIEKQMFIGNDPKTVKNLYHHLGIHPTDE